MKTIVHIAMHTTNIGDGALVRGIQSTLPTDMQTEIKFIDHCITDFLTYHKLKFDLEYVDWLNNHADLLLIGGGGLISTKHALPLILNPDILAKVKKPVVVYAVGHNLFYGEALENAPALSALITQIRDLGGLFSVRSDGSLERLRKDLGSRVMELVREVPDPGVFVPVEAMPHPQIRAGHRNIVLQLAGDKLTNRISSDAAEKASGSFSPFQKRVQKKREKSSKHVDGVLERIANVCNTISIKHDVNFVIAPHIHSDLAVTKDFVSATRQISGTKHLAGSRLEVSGILRGARGASAFFDLYRQADFVIGMRGHSLIVAVGVGTPCVGIVSHPKVEGFLKECSLEKWSTNVADENIEESLLEKISCLMDDASEWKRLREIALERMMRQRKLFHSDIKRLMQ